MGQDLKCALGMHKLEIQDTLEVKNTTGVIGLNFVCRCKECERLNLSLFLLVMVILTEVQKHKILEL